MSVELPKHTKSVKDLRANFEKKGGGAVLTPEQFMKEKKQMAEREYAAIMLARKKAAAYNMAIRQVELQQRKQSMLPPLAVVTAPEVVPQENVRRAARRVSVSLNEAPLKQQQQQQDVPLPAAPTFSTTPSHRPSATIQQRRGTSLLLAAMCEELEVEMKQEELTAIKEEEEARQRLESAVEFAAKENANEDLRLAQEEKLRAIEIQELARKEAEAARAEQAALETEAALQELTLKAEASNAAEAKDRQVLLAFLNENHPEKIGEIDNLLAQFKGNLEVLFEELGKAQVFEEKPDNGKSLIQEEVKATPTKQKNSKDFLNDGVDLRVVICSFYTVYAKSKLPEIDGILAHFANREADLFRTLEVKYDVTFSPDGTCVPNATAGGDFYSSLDAMGSGGGSQRGGTSKFAVDVQSRQLKERLSKQGQSAESVNQVLANGSGMM